MKSKAVLGVIPYMGGEWSVEHATSKTDNGSITTSSTKGYGEFPFARFDIPVIDYRDNDAVFEKLSANIACIETTSPHTKLYKLMPLAEYLQWHIDHEIPVLNYNQ